jgi:hypothetical protein
MTQGMPCPSAGVAVVLSRDCGVAVALGRFGLSCASNGYVFARSRCPWYYRGPDTPAGQPEVRLTPSRVLGRTAGRRSRVLVVGGESGV